MYHVGDVAVLLGVGENVDDGVHLVPQLGGLDELAGGHGGLTGSTGDAVHLLSLASSVHQEAEPSGHINLNHRNKLVKTTNV